MLERREQQVIGHPKSLGLTFGNEKLLKAFKQRSPADQIFVLERSLRTLCRDRSGWDSETGK